MNEWACTAFESGPGALDDLVQRIAAAIRRQTRLRLAAVTMAVEGGDSAGDPGSS